MSPQLAAWLARGAARAQSSTERLNDRAKTAPRLNIGNIRAENGANPPVAPSTDGSNVNIDPATLNAWVEGLNATFAALADPTRRVMLMMLRGGELSVGDLARPHAMSFAAAAKHVQVLERAGLITRRRAGRRHLCALRADRLREAHRALGRWEACWATPGG